jgi:two-component sensor histidine kinase
MGSIEAADVMRERYTPVWQARNGDAAAETDHRVANSLALIVSLVRTHARTVARSTGNWRPEQVSFLLEEMAGRIETVGRLHRLVSRQSAGTEDSTDLSDYVKEICDSIFGALSSADRFSIMQVPSRDCTVPIQQALPLGLIVCEVVTNAIKYSHPANVQGVIWVACGREPNGSVFLEIADDGVGFPEGFDAARDGGQGLRLVRGLAEQLMATYAFDDSGLGLRFRLTIPRSELHGEA